ncbi:MAG TPA: hypothetical protein VK628_08415, partial [Flavitalea sp.]|nr:hypothetical protein [Flavitalea sp.]
KSRVVVTVKPADLGRFRKFMGDQAFEELGVVTSGAIEVDGQDWGTLSAWKEKYNTAIEKLIGVNANN